MFRQGCHFNKEKGTTFEQKNVVLFVSVTVFIHFEETPLIK